MTDLGSALSIVSENRWEVGVVHLRQCRHREAMLERAWFLQCQVQVSSGGGGTTCCWDCVTCGNGLPCGACLAGMLSVEAALVVATLCSAVGFGGCGDVSGCAAFQLSRLALARGLFMCAPSADT